jgi:hypothetical protein
MVVIERSHRSLASLFSLMKKELQRVEWTIWSYNWRRRRDHRSHQVWLFRFEWWRWYLDWGGVTFGLDVDWVGLLPEPYDEFSTVSDCEVSLLVDFDHTWRLLP